MALVSLLAIWELLAIILYNLTGQNPPLFLSLWPEVSVTSFWRMILALGSVYSKALKFLSKSYRRIGILIKISMLSLWLLDNSFHTI
jgi:hypothetical protein